MSLNPNVTEAHTQMGPLQQLVDYYWTGANASFQRAIAVEPDNPEGVRGAAYGAAELGRFGEAFSLVRRAVRLDPLNAQIGENFVRLSTVMGS